MRPLGSNHGRRRIISAPTGVWENIHQTPSLVRRASVEKSDDRTLGNGQGVGGVAHEHTALVHCYLLVRDDIG